jgi:hypothetical protein
MKRLHHRGRTLEPNWLAFPSGSFPCLDLLCVHADEIRRSYSRTGASPPQFKLLDGLLLLMIPKESAPSIDTAAASRAGQVAHIQGFCGQPDDTQGRSGAQIASDASGFSYAEFTPVKHRKNRKNNKMAALKERLATTPLQHLRRARQKLLDDDHDWLSKASRRFLFSLLPRSSGGLYAIVVMENSNQCKR